MKEYPPERYTLLVTAEYDSTLRRRLRRSRATARYLWWLHRTGHRIPSLRKLQQIRKTLEAHHSKDPQLLRVIHLHLKAMASHVEPWKCKSCLRMVKAKAEFCPSCGGWWEDVWDATFQHQRRQESSKRTDNSWTWHNWTREPSAGARRRNSSAKKKGAAKGSGKDKSFKYGYVVVYVKF